MCFSEFVAVCEWEDIIHKCYGRNKFKVSEVDSQQAIIKFPDLFKPEMGNFKYQISGQNKTSECIWNLIGKTFCLTKLKSFLLKKKLCLCFFTVLFVGVGTYRVKLIIFITCFWITLSVM